MLRVVLIAVHCTNREAQREGTCSQWQIDTQIHIQIQIQIQIQL